MDTMFYRSLFMLLFCATSIGETLMYLINIDCNHELIKTVQWILNTKPLLDPSSKDGNCSEFKGQIEFSQVSFGNLAKLEKHLANINFILRPGRTLALVGTLPEANSCILKLLLRLYFPLVGEILIDEVNIKRININCLRKQIGFISNEAVLFNCSVAENINYAANFSAIDIFRVAKELGIHDFIMSLPEGYSTNCGTSSYPFTKLQIIAIAIARVFIRNPKIVLFDHVTDAMDLYGEDFIQKMITVVQKDRTCIIASAPTQFAMENADEIAVISNGSIVEYGTLDDLLNNGSVFPILYGVKEEPNNNIEVNERPRRSIEVNERPSRSVEVEKIQNNNTEEEVSNNNSEDNIEK